MQTQLQTAQTGQMGLDTVGTLTGSVDGHGHGHTQQMVELETLYGTLETHYNKLKEQYGSLHQQNDREK